MIVASGEEIASKIYPISACFLFDGKQILLFVMLIQHTSRGHESCTSVHWLRIGMCFSLAIPALIGSMLFFVDGQKHLDDCAHGDDCLERVGESSANFRLTDLGRKSICQWSR